MPAACLTCRAGAAATENPALGGARRDASTPNRGCCDALFFLGEYQLELARRTGRSFALLYITVENAEKTSEYALRGMAQLLLSNFRASDACAHLGAGDFCVLLSDVSHSRVGPEIACLRLLDRLEDMTLDGRLPFPVALRTGVASFGREDKVTFAEMVAHAQAQGRD